MGDRGLSPSEDESPNYQVRHYFKWPDLETEIVFTPDAPRSLVQNAFDVRLNCLWSILGCRAANQILPQAEEDRKTIEAAMVNRMRSDNQCPESILSGRARDTTDILLVTVKRVGEEYETQYPPTKLHDVDFHLERVLKGTVNRPLTRVPVYRDMYAYWTGTEEWVHNSAYDLLLPGQRLLLFSDSSTGVGSPCEAMAASDTAVSKVTEKIRETANYRR